VIAFSPVEMPSSLDEFERHVIVCGAGRTGAHVVNELVATRTPCVVIDTDAERIERLREDLPEVGFILGDATEDETLAEAGIARAAGIVASLAEDKDNLYITLSARTTNPSLRIIAKGVETSSEPKLRRAGADRVVSPNAIGGMRLASEILRPNVVEFLDLMLRDPEHVLRIEEATVSPRSSVVGRSIGTVGLRKICDVLIVSARLPGGKYAFNPGAELVLEPGLTLIVLGERAEIVKLRVAVGDRPEG
jgi:voltage-gated potassium channel